jgi:hypothetical protein
MNDQYLDTQCKNMLCVISAFLTACNLTALVDDGELSAEEEKKLHQIKTAAGRFQGELTRVIGKGE